MKVLRLLVIVMLVFLVGCSSDNTASDTSKDSGEKKVGKSFSFEYNGLEIAMNAEAEPILAKLGDSMEYFESESCAFKGLDKIYTYSGFELHTYPLEGVDYVSAVKFLDDSVATKEGIRFFSKLEDVTKAYGDDYSENLGLYIYQADDSRISFLTKEDEVLAIEYNAVVDKK